MLFISANNIKGKKDIKFSVVRYGNVMASNGSVIPFFKNLRDQNKSITITDPNMTRFNISIEDGVKMVIYALENAWGGELFVPKIPSYHIMDLAKAIAPNSKIEIVGIRPGEKVHEEMITKSDSFLTYDIGMFYSMLPSKPNWNLEDYIKKFNAVKVKEGYSYNSGENSHFETVETLREKIKNIDK